MRIRKVRQWAGKIAWRTVLVVALLLVATETFDFFKKSNVWAAAQSQEADLRLRLRRDFGYGAGTQIRGRFSMIVDELDGLQRVEFLIDDEVVGNDSEAPFRLQFNTSGYELGWHTLRAVGFTVDGRELRSNVFQRQFVTGSASTYIVVAVVALILGFRLVSYLVTRNKATEQKKYVYGMYGGAICPRCGRPFSRHWWAPNLIAGKLDRCPHCGKWHFSTRATPQMLASAERFADELDAEEGDAVERPGKGDEEEQLRKRLDESRFE